MAYRTRTYIAGDWDNDIDLVEQLRKWNESPYWRLDFVDAHDFKQAHDDSLYCSVKKSLRDRMDHSKTFVLIVGDHTKSTKKETAHIARTIRTTHKNVEDVARKVIRVISNTNAKKRSVMVWTFLCYTSQQELIGKNARMLLGGQASISLHASTIKGS